MPEWRQKWLDGWVSKTLPNTSSQAKWGPGPVVEVLSAPEGEIWLRWPNEPHHPDFWGGYRVWRSDSPSGPFSSSAEIVAQTWNSRGEPGMYLAHYTGEQHGDDGWEYLQYADGATYFFVTKIDLEMRDGPASGVVCATSAGPC